MKLPSPVRRRIYEFIILASDDPFENDADSVKITRFVRYPEDPTLRLYQLWTGKWDRYLQLNDGPPLYPLAYSSMSTGRIQNFAKILPEDESAEFQKLFWQSSVLSFTKVRATETASRDNPLLPPDFPVCFSFAVHTPKNSFGLLIIYRRLVTVLETSGPMPISPVSATWRSTLTSCRTEMAERSYFVFYECGSNLTALQLLGRPRSLLYYLRFMLLRPRRSRPISSNP